MSDTRHAHTEIIDVNDVLSFGSVSEVETIRVKWSIRIAIFALAIAAAALFYGIYADVEEVLTWATGLISAIAGAAISFGFNSRGS